MHWRSPVIHGTHDAEADFVKNRGHGGFAVERVRRAPRPRLRRRGRAGVGPIPKEGVGEVAGGTLPGGLEGIIAPYAQRLDGDTPPPSATAACVLTRVPGERGLPALRHLPRRRRARLRRPDDRARRPDPARRARRVRVDRAEPPLPDRRVQGHRPGPAAPAVLADVDRLDGEHGARRPLLRAVRRDAADDGHDRQGHGRGRSIEQRLRARHPHRRA